MGFLAICRYCNMENPSYNKKYNLRLPQELYDRIVELGRKHDRSVNEQIVNILRTWHEPAALEDRLSKLEAQVLKPNSEKKEV